jgi:alpha-ribazole phosphatase
MRHGEPAVTGRLLGHADVAATPAGMAACRAAARAIGGAAIVSSDLSRAAACAAAAGEALALPVRVDPRWRELDFGAWDGCTAADLDPADRDRFWQDPDAYPPPGGERWSALVARAADALGDLGDGTLVVTHAGAMRAALAAACGLDARQVWAFDLPYAAVLTLTLWREDGRLSAQVTGLRR